jgi:transposase-like protein
VPEPEADRGGGGEREDLAQACREAGIADQTYYRWRKEYGGLKLDQPKRLKELEKENLKLKAVGGRALAGKNRFLRTSPRETSKPRAVPGRGATCAR